MKRRAEVHIHIHLDGLMAQVPSDEVDMEALGDILDDAWEDAKSAYANETSPQQSAPPFVLALRRPNGSYVHSSKTPGAAFDTLRGVVESRLANPRFLPGKAAALHSKSGQLLGTLGIVTGTGTAPYAPSNDYPVDTRMAGYGALSVLESPHDP